MGCGKSKASAPKTAAPASSTLLDSPTQKAVVEKQATFAVFLDSVRSSDCLLVDEKNAFLQVNDVTGGPIGLWNNRAHTEKVSKGDLVVKLRKVQPNGMQWLEGNAKEMLEALKAEGPFEIEVRRPATEQNQASEQPVEASNPTGEPEKEDQGIAAAQEETAIPDKANDATAVPTQQACEESPKVDAASEKAAVDEKAAVETVTPVAADAGQAECTEVAEGDAKSWGCRFLC